MTVRIINADVMDGLRQLPDESVHCVVTSPPYFRLRDYGVEGQIGLEPTPEAFVSRMVEVFREVRRVLRSDGTCWMNLGDSYASDPKKGRVTAEQSGKAAYLNGQPNQCRVPMGGAYKPKDLMGMPWRVALALQADGWWLRADIIWSKPNPMPESVTDRPSRAHEYVFLLTKRERYFYDAVAIMEEVAASSIERLLQPNLQGQVGSKRANAGAKTNGNMKAVGGLEGRNKRTVWNIATQPFSEAHFATFPEELPATCILAGTSQHGCCGECGAPWSRETEVSYEKSPYHSAGSVAGRRTKTGANNFDGALQPRLAKRTETTGWVAGCACDGEGRHACTVLDPFSGSGTTGLVADRLQRNAILVELNPEYAAMAERRINGDRGALLDLMEAPETEAAE